MYFKILYSDQCVYTRGIPHYTHSLLKVQYLNNLDQWCKMRLQICNTCTSFGDGEHQLMVLPLSFQLTTVIHILT